MPKPRKHPYLTKEFWEENKFWKNEMHSKHEYYEETIKSIIDSFRVKEDNIFDKMKQN